MAVLFENAFGFRASDDDELVLIPAMTSCFAIIALGIQLPRDRGYRAVNKSLQAGGLNARLWREASAAVRTRAARRRGC